MKEKISAILKKLKKYLDKKYWKVYVAVLLALVVATTAIVWIAVANGNNEPEETTPEQTTPGGDPVVPPSSKTAEEIVATLNATATFNSTFGCDEAILTDVESKDAIVAAFTAEDFTAVAVDRVEGARIETLMFSKGKELVTLYWIASDKEMRITWEEADEAALSVLQKNASTGEGTLTMVQIGVARGEAVDNPMIGMCYVFKLSNGRAMIIDGGFYYDDCAENVYNALAKLDIAKTEDDKFIIEAWIFTHGHGDHDGVLNNFIPLYGEKAEINYFLYQFPANEEISAVGGGEAGEEAFHELCKTAYPNATYINPHVGLNYYFGNATVSMLYTPDILWAPDNKITYYNNTSLIFKVGGGETAFLCMGDAGELAAERSWDLFDATAYESGILQITHHGLNTSEGSSFHDWDNIKKIYESTGASYAVLPLGTRTGDSLTSGNGRWTVLFAYPYNDDSQMSFIVKKGDAPTSSGYFNQELFNRFVATVETGRNVITENSSLAGYSNVKSLHGYNGLNMIDNGNGLITYIASSDKTEMATVFRLAGGEITVQKNEELTEWLKLPEFNTSDVIAKIDGAAELFESTFGNQEVVLKNVADKANVVSAFTEAGFESIAVTPVAGAKFETLLFTNGMELATLYWKPDAQEMRILWEKLDENILSVLEANKTTGTGELTMVQVGVQRGPEDTGNPMIGMCYVIKLSNGRAIVIDGGFDYENNADNLFGTLSKLGIAKNAKDKYMIEAWIFSHGHSDHNGILSVFAPAYGDKTDVNYFLYQLPTNGDVSAVGAGVAGESAFHELCKSAYPNATYLKPSANITYYFGNASINMLYTPDLVWSPDNKITYYNDTSLVFKLQGGGTSFLCFGDAGEDVATALWSLYDSAAFESDIFQITHHGLTTQEGDSGHGWENLKKVYEATGATTALLPMGTAYEEGDRNGRYTVIFQYGNKDYQMSFVVNKDNAPFASKYFNASVFDAFIEDVETGSNRMQTEFNLGDYKTLYGYDGINIIDNGAGLITYIATRDKTEMATVFSMANGNVTMVENDELSDWLAAPTQTEERYESTFNSYEEVYINVKSKDLFVDKFTAEGYTLLDVDNIDGARFETILLQKGSELVVLYWFPEDQEMRVVCETIDTDSLAPLTPNATTGTGEVTLIQMGIERDNRDPSIATDKGNPLIGMCYIMKLSNGKAIIIDGGFNYETDADNLYNALVKLDIAKDADGKFLIEAWIFSHGHSDHNGILTSFSQKYGDQSDVKYFMYQIPTNKALSDTGAGVAGEAAFHALCKEAYPNSTYILPHAGLKYYFGNATIDMLYTPDLIWSPSNRLPDYNDTSIITHWQAGGTAFLSFGDAGEIPATAVWNNYDVTAFASSILQMAHHGLTTGANESQEWRNLKKIYEGAGVDYVFLPMGSAYGTRNGRWSVLCGWGYTGGQASFALNRNDDAAGVSMAAYDTFIASVKAGTNNGKTFLGYNGVNLIDNGQGRVTYIASGEDVPMVTVVTFANGEATVELNTELYTWLEG